MIKTKIRRLLLTTVIATSLVVSSAVPVMAETSVNDLRRNGRSKHSRSNLCHST